MEDAIQRRKQSEDQKDRVNAKYRKLVFIIIAILLFSGIAILSIILEKPKSQWALISSDASGELPDTATRTSDPSDRQTAVSTEDSGNVSSKTASSGSPDAFPVYIVGEVCIPGIYQVEPGMFLYQLVEMAGGLTAKAARNSINLAFKITRNQMIRIPSLDEVEKGDTGGVAEGLLLTDGACFEDNGNQQNTSAKININTAGEKELDELPGIGAATAKLIIDYRTKNGEFKTIEDIMKIPGIKQNKFAQIKDQIIV